MFKPQSSKYLYSSFSALYNAISPRSPVLILTVSSTGITKILPSPTSPVCAAPWMAAMVGSTFLSRTTIFKSTRSMLLVSYITPRYQHFKAIKNISLLLFHDYFKFIQSYRILLTNCKHSSFSSLQFEKRQILLLFPVYIFLSIPTKSRTFATEIKQIVIENIRKTIKKSSLTRGKT